MNYDQNFYQQQNPSPAPRKPKSNTKWFVLAGIVLAFIGLLAYGAVQLGKKVGNEINHFTTNTVSYADSMNETANSEAYASLLNEINSDTRIMDSIKNALAQKVTALHERASFSRGLIRKYGNGFQDTMQGQGGLSQFNKIWAHDYFIRTGRATEIKNSLLALRDSTFMELPYSQKDSTLLHKISVYDLNAGTPDYLRTLTSWEAIHYDQPAMTVSINIKTELIQVSNYESALLDIYRNYFRMQGEAAGVHP